MAKNELFLEFFNSLLNSVSSDSIQNFNGEGSELESYLSNLNGNNGSIPDELKLLVSKIKEQIYVNRILKVHCPGEIVGCYLHNEVGELFAPKACFVTLKGSKGQDIQQSDSLKTFENFLK